MEELIDLDLQNVSKFTLENNDFISRVTNVVDGDTVDVVFKYNGSFYKWRCRLYGINTPEIRTSDKKEKEVALKIKEYVEKNLLDKIVTVKCHDFDSFGRLLVQIYINGQNFNQKLINMEFACEYKNRHEYKRNYDTILLNLLL